MKYINIIIFLLVIFVFVVEGYLLSDKTNDVVIETSTSTVLSVVTSTDVTVDVTSSSNIATETLSIPSPVVKKTTTSTPSITYSKTGQSLVINGVSVTPLHITYDGRCPVDVKCIQAGTVDISLLLKSGPLSQNTMLSLGKSVLFAGKNITFVSVTPKKVSTKTIKEADYRFVITVKN